MSELAHRIRVKTIGLTPKEVTELEAILQASEHVAATKLRIRTQDAAFDSASSIQATIAAHHIILELTGAAVVFINANPFLKTIQEELAKDVMKWLRSKYSGGSSVEVAVQILGSDGGMPGLFCTS